MNILLIFMMICSIIASKYCDPDEPCWPSDDDIKILNATLDPSLPRILKWNGGNNPRVSGVPINSPGD